jgi:hypothetical protein
MSRVKIKVGNTFLDTLEGFDDLFYLTETIYNIKDLNTRNASFSRTIILPLTKNNASAFDRLTNEQLGNKSFETFLYIDNILFAAGRILIINDSRYTLECIFLYSNFDLFDKIPNQSIKELNFSEYDFPFTPTDFAALATNTEGPVLSYHNWIDEQSLFYEGQIPSIQGELDIKMGGFDMYQKTIFKKIIETAGYTHDDSGINTNDTYNKLVLAVPLPAFLQEDVPTGTSSQVSLNSQYQFQPVSSSDFGVVPWDNIISDPSGSYDPINDEYVIGTAGTYSFTCDYNIDYIQNTAGFGAIDLEVNGTSVDNYTTFLAANGIIGNLSILQAFNVGDTIRVTVSCGYQNQNNRDQLNVNTASQFNLTQTNDPLTGNVVVSDWLPDISQRQFFSDFCKFFNLIVYSEQFERKAEFKFWKDYIKETPKDLSDKVDVSREITNEISLPYYRQSEMSFSNDSLERTDSNYIINLSFDESLPPYGTILNIGYSNSDKSEYQTPVPISSGLVTPYFRWTYTKWTGFSITQNTTNFTVSVTNQLPQFQPGMYILFGGTRGVCMRVSQRTGLGTGIFYNQYTEGTISNGDAWLIEVEGVDLTPRHGKLKTYTPTNTSIIVNSNELGNIGSGVGTQCDSFEALTMTDIYNEFYSDMFEAFQTPKVITCWMVFNTVELYTLALETPVYIKDFNGSFHVNILEQWKLNTPCRVELVRINKLI